MTESIAGCIRGAAAVLRGGEILDFGLLVWKFADRLQLRGNVSFFVGHSQVDSLRQGAILHRKSLILVSSRVGGLWVVARGAKR